MILLPIITLWDSNLVYRLTVFKQNCILKLTINGLVTYIYYTSQNQICNLKKGKSHTKYRFNKVK